MADARKVLRATIAETPWNTGLWIVHVSLVVVKRSTFAMVIVGVWLRRGCLRLSRIQVGMLVWGRVGVHLSWTLARSVRPYVAGENVGRVTTCAWGGFFEVLRAQVGAGRDGFVVEEGSVAGVHYGVDYHCGM